MKINKKIFKYYIVFMMTLILISNIFLIYKINVLESTNSEYINSTSAMNNVFDKVGIKDDVLFDNIDIIDVIFKDNILNIKKTDLDTVELFTNNSSYNILDKEILKEIDENKEDNLIKDYLLIEGLMFNIYRLEAEKEIGAIDTTNKPSNLQYIEPISETLKEKYVKLKISSDYYKEIEYKLTINKKGIIIEER